MDIKAFIVELSRILASDATVTYALYAAMTYAGAVVLILAFHLAFETTTFLRLQLIVRTGGTGVSKVQKLNRLFKAQMPGVEDAQSGGWSSMGAANIAQKVWYIISAAHRTRVGRATAALLRAYAAHGAGSHQKAKILPSEGFMLDHDPGPPTNINRWFDTLIRISLIITFAGIAAVLFSTGEAVTALSGSDASTTADNTQIIGEISKVIGAASTKFFSTVFALVFGTGFLIVSYVVAKLIDGLLYLTSVSMDGLLVLPDVEEQFAADADTVITGDMREKSKMIRALGDVGDQIRKVSSSFDNQLIAGMRAMQADQAKRMDDFITQLGALLDGLYSRGIALPVQSAVSEPIQQMMADLSRQIGGVAIAIEDQEGRAADNIRALVEIFEREQGAARAHSVEMFQKQFEANRVQAAEMMERQRESSRKQSEEITAVLRRLEELLGEQRGPTAAEAAAKTPADDPAVRHFRDTHGLDPAMDTSKQATPEK